MEQLKFKIITPEGTYLDDVLVDFVNVKTAAGEITIYKNHMPIVSTLGINNLKYQKNGKDKYIHIHRGIIQVTKEQVKILTQRLYEVDKDGRKIESKK